MAEELQKLYLTNIHLKGFKSIIDVEIDIKKGLNILIGKNGAGKSNFLEGVSDALQSTHNYPVNVNSRFIALSFTSEKDDVFEIILEKNDKNSKINQNNSRKSISFDGNLDSQIFKNKKLVFDSKVERDEAEGFDVFKGSLWLKLLKLGIDFADLKLIPFNNPKELDFIEKSGFYKLIISDGKPEYFHDFKTLDFVDFIFRELHTYYMLNIGEIATDDIGLFYKCLEIPNDIIDNLKRFTPIEDLRFNPNIVLYPAGNILTFDNIKLDFKVNGDWQPWSQLSDGTKRLFILVAEITHHQGGLILVEEPELGVHPHQFYKIMTFLKEQAETKQIIISTHSPQALNHLGPDELDNLIIAKYEAKKGTQLYHLTNEQKAKAKDYMDEIGFLSDYWMHSDLEEW